MTRVNINIVPISKKQAFATILRAYLRELASDDNRRAPQVAKPYPYFDLYWSDPDRWPFFIESDGQRVGFALVRRVVGTIGELFEMAEFFKNLQDRGKDTGSAATHLLFHRFPGVRQVSQMNGREGVTEFWRTVIGNYTSGMFTEIKSPDQRHGYRQTFISVANQHGAAP